MKVKFLALLLVFVFAFFITTVPVYAATSPTLGNAASFAVLGGTAITNVPTSVITGDVGLSPAAGSNITGLAVTSQVSGTIYAVDASGPAGSAGNNPTLVNNAKTDLVSAYDALSAAPNVACDTTYPGAKDLVGESLVAGIYCADTFALSGTLTLTGSGVWIFRSAATLTTSGTANVVGGDPCDVWWKVVSSATLGTNTSLKGNILALTSITLNTGATLTGRALARNGAVSLDSNTINQSCTSPVTPTPTPTVAPTATPTPTSSSTNSSTSGSGGDGLSDGRSDGRSDGLSSGAGGAIVMANSPGFPNTGIGPSDKNILIKIFAGIFMILAIICLTRLINSKKDKKHE